MPCVNTQNGQPVPGAQGQCPIGSTWRHPNGAEIEAGRVYDLPPGSYGRDDEGTSTGELTPGWFGRNQMSKEDIDKYKEGFSMDAMMNRKPLMNRPDWMPDWGVDAGILAAGMIGGGRNPGSKKSMAQAFNNMGTRLKDSKLMDKLFNKGKQKFKDMREFKGQYEPMIPSNVALNLKGKLSGIPSAAAFKSLMNSPKGKKRLIAMGITAPSALMIMNSPSSFFGNGTEDSTATSTPPAATPNAAEIAAKAEAARVAGLNPLESMLENMKKKGFWTDPINKDGSRTDTRLNRLGILMDYYGKDPVQRAASTSPSEQFAQSDKDYAVSQAAYLKAQNELNNTQSVLTKMGDDELDAVVRPRVMKELGFSDWTPFNEPSDPSVEQDVATVKTLVRQYHTVDGLPINEAIDKAVSKVTNTNIPFLPFF